MSERTELDERIMHWMPFFTFPYQEIRLILKIQAAATEFQKEFPETAIHFSVLNPDWDLNECREVAFTSIVNALEHFEWVERFENKHEFATIRLRTIRMLKEMIARLQNHLVEEYDE